MSTNFTNEPCPQCGAPLDSTGWCRHHRGQKPVPEATGKPEIEVEWTITSEPAPVPSLVPGLLWFIAISTFSLMVFYTFFGRTLGFFEVGDYAYLVVTVLKLGPSLYLALYYARYKNVFTSFVAVIFFVNFVLNLIILGGILLDL